MSEGGVLVAVMVVFDIGVWWRRRSRVPYYPFEVIVAQLLGQLSVGVDLVIGLA